MLEFKFNLLTRRQGNSASLNQKVKEIHNFALDIVNTFSKPLDNAFGVGIQDGSVEFGPCFGDSVHHTDGSSSDFPAGVIVVINATDLSIVEVGAPIASIFILIHLFVLIVIVAEVWVVDAQVHAFLEDGWHEFGHFLGTPLDQRLNGVQARFTQFVVNIGGSVLVKLLHNLGQQANDIVQKGSHAVTHVFGHQ